MIEEKTFTQIEQTPEVAGNYLYKSVISEYTGDESRMFATKVRYEEGTTPWLECTPQEKAEWEAAHSTETLNERVTRLIRREYDQSQENHMNRIGGKIVMNLATEEEKAEWLAFNTYVEQCIEEAKQQEPEPESV